MCMKTITEFLYEPFLALYTIYGLCMLVMCFKIPRYSKYSTCVWNGMSLEGSWISICWEMQWRHYVDRRFLKILSLNVLRSVKWKSCVVFVFSQYTMLYIHKTLDVISTSMHKYGSTKTPFILEVYCIFIWFTLHSLTWKIQWIGDSCCFYNNVAISVPLCMAFLM